MKGWHFCSINRRLGYGDNREITAGESLTVDCEPILCRQGLHASERIIDALRYSTGSVISYVELRGTIVRGDDKAVATERHTYWMLDAKDLLREFACWCALSVIDKWDPPDVVIRYLKTRDETIQNEARIAARAAAWAAAGDIAGAARAAAWAATEGAAWNAASVAAEIAAMDAQNKQLYKLVLERKQILSIY